ncbi:hydroxyproline O-arabinosyltransferase PLENTY isoform X2 [Eucalyptus grandis]|uniref:hydroxyproline O-arabinosyltransferase PLENTY isoform X2 n=1 Tax=Eucalyptus grandis TaxID=71139 RepID=UPI00192EDBBA|nr:hydroxyproline O-arabinosyltransferase PLENTY isoform X2 [Eucalyptus grandis]
MPAIERKHVRRVSPLFVVFGLVFLFAAYNLLHMVMHNKGPNPGAAVTDALGMSDPVTGLRYHVAVTATDAPYSQWQCRIMYYWYKKVRDMPGSDMGNFTRILHSGRTDHLMEEMHTFVVDPLPDGLDRGYIVLNRPWAFVQWLESATIEEEYILMAEPDHIFSILEEIAPTWMNVSLRMKEDPETDKAFGWVLEMYGYAVASALHKVKHILRKDFMLQPPWDLEVGKSFIIHYTYGCDYSMKGELTYGKIGEWRFDKRSYLSGPPPRNLSLPPPGVPESVVRLVKMVNEATANIPKWETLNRS